MGSGGGESRARRGVVVESETDGGGVVVESETDGGVGGGVRGRDAGGA